MSKSNKVKIGVLGCGTVGSALLELIEKHNDQLEVVRVGIKSLDKKRSIPNVYKRLLTEDLHSIVQDPDIDIVVELIGVADLAKELIQTALKNSKPVVTANKELLAQHGPELFELAAAQEVGLGFEASAAGAIPVVRTLRDYLNVGSVSSIVGILNGTTNYILSQMSECSIDAGVALATAQDLGFAESNPEKDVNGKDTAAKIAILAGLAFGQKVEMEDIHCEGIESIQSQDISLAAQLGYTIKLLAIAEQVGTSIAIRVHPAMILSSHQLAKVSGSYNAVYIKGEALGNLMLYGNGAGGAPTATAVLADILEIVKKPYSKVQFPSPAVSEAFDILPMEDLETAYYLRIQVEDSPGVLATVSKVFDQHKISIKSMNQSADESLATLVFITHTTLEKDFNNAIDELSKSQIVKNVAAKFRLVEI